MLYAQWVQKVLEAMEASEDVRTRLVGLPVLALREPLSIDVPDVDAIEDAVDDLAMLGLVVRRPAGTFNLTTRGSEAAERSIVEVCGATIGRVCAALTDDQRSFLRALMELSETEYSGFARVRYVNVEQILAAVGLRGAHEWQEAFLLPLVVNTCIDYREYQRDRDARPLFTGVICASAGRERLTPFGHRSGQT